MNLHFYNKINQKLSLSSLGSHHQLFRYVKAEIEKQTETLKSETNPTVQANAYRKSEPAVQANAYRKIKSWRVVHDVPCLFL